ncbi:transcription antitermination factor NusB [Ornithinimicrobium humiphilum]|uniref:Transcription antitermination protein NusB n=1 Tax=Ornithinimicrobium humiphilum TaxID=125288 RepID=A0A543KPN6_9MICO|nr:transcription antitermination factor NusB [Ornithinimicrobium humiphilum]TQM97031.1 NusB antitermination factor [Ornithinimicrobium humiphilum]
MAARTKARKRALELLFEAEQRGLNVGDLLEQRVAAPTTQHPLPEYAVQLVRGVLERWSQIDEILTTYSQGWTLERMAAVDRAALRLGVWEILWNDEVPDSVAISEAVSLVEALSTDDSPRFVNGLLARVSEVRDTLV